VQSTKRKNFGPEISHCSKLPIMPQTDKATQDTHSGSLNADLLHVEVHVR